MHRIAAILLLSLALAACAATGKERLKEAAIAPLGDLNLVPKEIPPALLEVQREPYRVSEAATCESLAAEVQSLDAVLGPDVDTPVRESEPSLLELGKEEATEAAVGALTDTAEGLIPFRGWVRKLSGAERSSRQVAAAITAGTARRAFIKGLMASRSCG